MFHKAMGAYFKNCTTSNEVQTRTHGQWIKHGIPNQTCKCNWIVRSRLHWESYTKATFFKQNQTCNKFNTCWLRKGLGKPHQQYHSQIATPKHTHTHTHTDTQTHRHTHTHRHTDTHRHIDTQTLKRRHTHTHTTTDTLEPNTSGNEMTAAGVAQISPLWGSNP